MKNKIFLIPSIIYLLFYLIPIAVYGETINPTDAKTITAAYTAAWQHEIDAISRKKEKILSSRAELCKNTMTASQCLLQTLRTVTIKSPFACVEYSKLISIAAKKDLDLHKITMSQSLLEINENLLLTLEQIDLTQSWLAHFRPNKKVDSSYVEEMKLMELATMKQVRDGILKIFRSNYLKWEKITSSQEKLTDKERLRQANVAKDLLKRENIQKLKVYSFIFR